MKCVLKDPYANAFYKADLKEMKPGVHERKWEVDPLRHPLRLAQGYWKITGDPSPFDEAWHAAVSRVLKIFRDQLDLLK